MISQDTIVAVATAAGKGGIAVVRLSGPDAVRIADKVWKGRRALNDTESRRMVYGKICLQDGEVLDDGLATVFRAPSSFTGEDTVEFGVHGSEWIQRELMGLLIDCGARMARAGEFSQRAFMNGKLDLAQAEGIADLISASSRAAHRLARMQTAGRFSRKLGELRKRLVEFASLLELELDFSEEDVEFADRNRLLALAEEIRETLVSLGSTYSSGQAFKKGIPVGIGGVPNAGKSTLLNVLLEDDRAIVSDIPGTTRDIIEDTRELGGVLFRFADTAGLRDTHDCVELQGIERARTRLNNSAIVLFVIDPTTSLEPQFLEFAKIMDKAGEGDDDSRNCILVVNKTDQDILPEVDRQLNLFSTETNVKRIDVSASHGIGIETMKEELVKAAKAEHNPDEDIMLTNARHYESIVKATESLTRAIESMKTILPTDFIAQDIRETIHHLSEITGAVTTPDLLQTIFSRFCIGK